LYVSKESLKTALDKLQGTADHMLKIWFVLKQTFAENIWKCRAKFV
jgi:hypothetical protein